MCAAVPSSPAVPAGWRRRLASLAGALLALAIATTLAPSAASAAVLPGQDPF